MYCDVDIILSDEGIVFESLTDPKVITISDDMLLAALRKIIFYGNGGSRILINIFYRQPIYIVDGFVEYNYMKLKCDNDVRKIFFIYSELFSAKCLIELNVTFGRSDVKSLSCYVN